MKPSSIASMPPSRWRLRPQARWQLPPRSRSVWGRRALVSLLAAGWLLGPAGGTGWAQSAPPCAAPPCSTASADAPPPTAPLPATLPPAGPATGPAETSASSLPGPRTTASRTGTTDPVRRRCKTAGVVLLSLTGVTLVGFFSVLIYNAVEHPGDLSLDPVPRLAFGLSTVTLGIAGSILLGYGLSAPPRPPSLPAPAPSPSLPPGVLPTAPDAPTHLGNPSTAAVELRF